MKRSTSLRRSSGKYPSPTMLEERRAWGESVRHCFICGGYYGLCMDTHEIVRRSQAPYRWCNLANLIRTCRRCHDEALCNVTVAPYAAQMAIKKLRDPEHYDYEAFVEILGRGPQCVTPEEIELCSRTLQMVGFGS